MTDTLIRFNTREMSKVKADRRMSIKNKCLGKVGIERCPKRRKQTLNQRTLKYTRKSLPGHWSMSSHRDVCVGHAIAVGEQITVMIDAIVEG